VQIKETQKSWNLRDLGVRREPFTLQNVRESVLCVWLSVCWEFSVVADQKCFLVYRGPTGSVPWTAVSFVFSGAFEVSSNGEFSV
jgi:hypothetical protein